MGGSIQLQALSFGREGRWWIGMMPRALLAVAVLIPDFCSLFIFNSPFSVLPFSTFSIRRISLQFHVSDTRSVVEPFMSSPYYPCSSDTALHRAKTVEGPVDLTHQFTIQVAKAEAILEVLKLTPHEFYLSRSSDYHTRSRSR